MKPRAFNVAEAKQRLSELLGKVEHGRERITIMKRGRPVAILSPAGERGGLGSVRGWLDDGDPFFQIVKEAVSKRHRRKLHWWVC